MAENEVNNDVDMRAEELGLNDKQMRFCQYYMKNKSAGMSYKKAYGDDIGKELQINSCYSNAHRLMKSEKIRNYLNLLKSEITKRAKMEASDILEKLENIAHDPACKISDQLKALELIGKYHSMWVEKVEMNSNSTIEINLNGIEDNPIKVIDHEEIKQLDDGNN